jgi:alpha-N-acetylglucosamine transferase
MKRAFVTYLGTDSFLLGVLMLKESLRSYTQLYDLLVIAANEHVSDESIDILINSGIKVKIVQEITNPNEIVDDWKGFKYLYTKLRIFELVEYQKIVYLDADLLICDNIESLFDKPHMSAVIAGKLTNPSWKDLNSGLMVVEPNQDLFNKMLSSIEKLLSNGGDQGFLHSFYRNWPGNTSLHLPHKFNVPSYDLNEYCRDHGFNFCYNNGVLNTNIAAIHFWGVQKPWNLDEKLLKKESSDREVQALHLWWDTFYNFINKCENECICQK